MESTVHTVLDSLEREGIVYILKEHPPVFTIEEMEGLELNRTAPIAKNLFLRDEKKRHYYLVVLPGRKRVDLKALRMALNSRPLSFASEEDLMSLLHLHKGAVTPLGILNDTENRVKVVVDNALLELPQIGVHPNVNTATVWLSPSALIKWIGSRGHTVIPIALEPSHSRRSQSVTA